MTVIAIAACSNSQVTIGQPDGGGADMTGADGPGGGHGDAGGSCLPGAPFGGGEAPAPGGSVTATIVDQSGAPVQGQPTYICGIDLCSAPAMTDPQGHVTLTTALKMRKPAFKFGDAVRYAELAIPLTQPMTSFGTLTTAKLPDLGAALTPGTDATSGGVTVSLPANASVGIDTLVYDTPEKQKLRIAAIAVDKATALLAPVQINGKSAGFALLYGLSPAESPVCPRARVTVALPHDKTMPNDLGWTANAAVEFWIMTTDVGQAYAPYAGWAKISDGTVAADGATASTVAGQGFNFLESFAIRLKQ